mmetsp:Transcript_16893/g.55044  ORF Transcript_16893/g.55044 Transcript_16893/m.55044 type:complete len:201 (+) Transcript_16893:164-766(+)
MAGVCWHGRRAWPMGARSEAVGAAPRRRLLHCLLGLHLHRSGRLQHLRLSNASQDPPRRHHAMRVVHPALHLSAVSAAAGPRSQRPSRATQGRPLALSPVPRVAGRVPVDAPSAPRRLSIPGLLACGRDQSSGPLSRCGALSRARRLRLRPVLHRRLRRTTSRHHPHPPMRAMALWRLPGRLGLHQRRLLARAQLVGVLP